MPDKISKAHRSWNMSRIRNKDTAIEIAVRKYLFSRGFRYRKNITSLPGKPDIVLPRYRTIIFVHGCYWHRHENCKHATTPGTRQDFWQKKFERNVLNDRMHQAALQDLGWRVIVLWECEIEYRFEETMQTCISAIISNSLFMNRSVKDHGNG